MQTALQEVIAHGSAHVNGQSIHSYPMVLASVASAQKFWQQKTGKLCCLVLIKAACHKSLTLSHAV